MAIDGYVKLHRAILDSGLWLTDEGYTIREAFIYLLIKANFKDVKSLYNGRWKVFKRGQLSTSMEKLSVEWKRDRKTVKKYLTLLEEGGMIKVEIDKSGTKITIINYNKYQDETPKMDNGMDNGMDNSMDTKEERKERERKTKNEKKEKKYIGISDPVLLEQPIEWQEPLKEFIEMRAYKKRKLTARAFNDRLNELRDIVGDDIAKGVAVINQTNDKFWDCFYPLKSEKGKIEEDTERAKRDEWRRQRGITAL